MIKRIQNFLDRVSLQQFDALPVQKQRKAAHRLFITHLVLVGLVNQHAANPNQPTKAALASVAHVLGVNSLFRGAASRLSEKVRQALLRANALAVGKC
jgi:hypothetical protein